MGAAGQRERTTSPMFASSGGASRQRAEAIFARETEVVRLTCSQGTETAMINDEDDVD